MKRKYKNIIACFLIIVFLGISLGVIDYNKIRNSEMPYFMIRVTDAKETKLTYLGLGYKMVRTVGVSYKEPLSSDKRVEFGMIFKTWEVEVKK